MKSIKKDNLFFEYGKRYKAGFRVERIATNCELGALRAFVISKYLHEKLTSTSIESNIRYSSGGAISEHDDYYKNRRVNISIKFNAIK